MATQSLVLITPEAYQKAKDAEAVAHVLRDQSIANMRASDPKYWTLERLADHWHLTKQSISVILEKTA